MSDIRRTNADPPHPALAEVIRLGNEGLRLADTANTARAEERLRQALALARSTLGEDDPATTVCLSNLGEFLSRGDRPDEALPLLRQALAQRDAASASHDVDRATPLANLALTLRRLGRFDEAEPLGWQALDLLAADGQGAGPEAAAVMNNLAQVLEHTERSGEAEPLMRRAIAIFERELGPDHPNVAVALNNLARLLERDGRAAQAEAPSQRHLLILHRAGRANGGRHALLGSAIANHAELLERLGASADQARAQVRALLDEDDAARASAQAGALPDLDRLAREGLAHGAPREAMDALFTATFRLPHWLFIATGDASAHQAHVKRDPGLERGAPMVKAFTDEARLQAYARENGLVGPDVAAPVLRLAVPDEAIAFLGGLAEAGVTHIHFNANRASDDHYLPLVQMPIVHRHLQRLGRLPKAGD